MSGGGRRGPQPKRRYHGGTAFGKVARDARRERRLRLPSFPLSFRHCWRNRARLYAGHIKIDLIRAWRTNFRSRSKFSPRLLRFALLCDKWLCSAFAFSFFSLPPSLKNSTDEVAEASIAQPFPFKRRARTTVAPHQSFAMATLNELKDGTYRGGLRRDGAKARTLLREMNLFSALFPGLTENGPDSLFAAQRSAQGRPGQARNAERAQGESEERGFQRH